MQTTYIFAGDSMRIPLGQLYQRTVELDRADSVIVKFTSGADIEITFRHDQSILVNHVEGPRVFVVQVSNFETAILSGDGSVARLYLSRDGRIAVQLDGDGVSFVI